MSRNGGVLASANHVAWPFVSRLFNVDMAKYLIFWRQWLFGRGWPAGGVSAALLALIGAARRLILCRRDREMADVSA